MYEYKARVGRIVDGDTVDLYVDLGFNITTKIRGRLINVDTPERGHEDWHEATAKCAELLRAVSDVKFENEPDEQCWVVVKTAKTGKFGRWLVDIEGVNDILAQRWPYKR